MATSDRQEIETGVFRASDGPDVARLHRLALPNGFLSTLGDGTLETLYGAISRHRDSTVIVARDVEGQVLGFVSGSTDVAQCYRHVLRTASARLAWHAAGSLVRPAVIKRCVETLTYPLRFRGKGGDAEPHTTARAELLSIAVDERARGLGVGRTLVEALDTFFAQAGHRGPYRVVTDASDPRSNAFYERTGFEVLGDFLHHGHPMRMYLRSNGTDRSASAARGESG